LVARSSRARAKPAEEINHGSKCPELSRSGTCDRIGPMGQMRII
jgi:hypothetical protein